MAHTSLDPLSFTHTAQKCSTNTNKISFQTEIFNKLNQLNNLHGTVIWTNPAGASETGTSLHQTQNRPAENAIEIKTSESTDWFIILFGS